MHHYSSEQFRRIADQHIKAGDSFKRMGKDYNSFPWVAVQSYRLAEDMLSAHPSPSVQQGLVTTTVQPTKPQLIPYHKAKPF